MTIKNYYSIFNIDSKSDLNTIKKAFRKEIAIYHPEVNSSVEAKERFNDLVEGFDILSNSEKREAYDSMLSASKSSELIIVEEQKKYESWQESSKPKSKTYRESSLTELFLLDIFADIGLQSVFEGSKTLIENSEPLIDGLGDTLGDVIGGIFDGL